MGTLRKKTTRAMSAPRRRRLQQRPVARPYTVNLPDAGRMCLNCTPGLDKNARGFEQVYAFLSLPVG
jgi:hypothetical protein